MRPGPMYQHITSRDTCFRIIKDFWGDKKYVEFYNLHSARMTGRHPMHYSCGEGMITLDKNEEHYDVVSWGRTTR